MIYSNVQFGYEGSIVSVEVDLRRGIPATDIVGLADSCVKEARERMIAAIRNSGFEYPSERVLISLSPADLKKEGAGFDLSIALAVLCANEADKMPRSQDVKVMVLGELELCGDVLPVKGVYSALSNAKENGIKYAIIPELSEAVPDGIIVKRVKNLREAFNALCNVDEIEDISNEDELRSLNNNNWGKTYDDNENINIEFDKITEEDERNFDSIKNNNGLKYAMAIAVAGRHNLMAWGKVGCGKTMVLQNMTKILPHLTNAERTSVQRIWSSAGLLRDNQKITTRPFRMPHQSASIEGICGGGATCRAGEISLAHNGVLFLDEAAEFRSSVLQMLRVPIETGQITLCRAGRSTVYPAKFQLVMTANPCPCGNYGQEDKICLCSVKTIEQYWKKLSAPLLDRVDIRFDCSLDIGQPAFTLKELQDMVNVAWKHQYKRQGKLNQDLDLQEVEEYIVLTDSAKNYLTTEAEKNGFTPRAITAIKKVARTLADIWTTPKTSNIKVDENYIRTAIHLHCKTPLEVL